jgi:hypothetical protein
VKTSYWVRCPHPGCEWEGDLAPRDATKIWRKALPLRFDVSFECPKCHGEWFGTLKGDEVEALPLNEM